ncbi:hypothetical protein LP420_05195 [Massilia sp. B-10]|nr:hypothetical protein LP420_05195 [Massilia sp. B-10]UUZ55174.1 hypothetical protein LP419_04865 [Massilia sp. H-1]
MAALSTSEMVSVPEVLKGALVSVRLAVAVLMTAASFVPRMLTVMVLLVPSALVTVKTSL